MLVDTEFAHIYLIVVEAERMGKAKISIRKKKSFL